MSEQCGRFENGRWVEGLPATMAAAGEPAGPELTGGAPLGPETPATEETAGRSGQAGCDEKEAGSASSGDTAPDLIAEASSSVTKAVDDVIRAAHHLVGTPSGHQYIEEQVNRAGSALSGILRDLAGRVDSRKK